MGGFTMSRKIPLTQGKFTIVDDADFDWLNQSNWYFHHGYAVRKAPRHGGKQRMIHMHREILGTPMGMETDHRNGDGLDNRRANLRVCTSSENHMNERKREGMSSQYKGVSRLKRCKKWKAQIYYDGVCHRLGRFTDEADAARAYNTAAREHFGEFACLNVIKEPRAGGAGLDADARA